MQQQLEHEVEISRQREQDGALRADHALEQVSERASERPYTHTVGTYIRYITPCKEQRAKRERP
jgi:hypothetical protein